MIPTAIRKAYFLCTFFLISFSLCFAQEEPLSPQFIKARGRPYPGIIHIHSIVSGGVYPLRRLVSLAQDKGIKILVFTDSFLMRWEYGLPVFSNIFKISREERSVVRYGVKHYLEDLKKIKEEFPDTVILEGVEVTPFYWWSGSLFKKNLSLYDIERHLLVVGLEKYQDYTRLPVLGNRYISPQLKDIPPLLIPIALIISGIFLLKKKQRKFLGLALNAAGILFLLNLFPFSASRYNPYHGPKNFPPYQDLINYVDKKGGLVFWPYPESASEAKKFATINFYTPSCTESLRATSGYAGFGVSMIPGTSHNLILAAGEWDKVLMGYCEGKRRQPVWAIGEAVYHGPGPIDSIQDIFFLPELTDKSVYEALRRGKLYVRYYSENNINISLHDFHIEEPQNKGKFAFMGDEIEIKGKPRLHIKGNYIINPPQDLRIQIIRDGQIIKEFKLTPPEKADPIREDSLAGFSNEKVFDLEFQDDSLQVLHKKSYYRLNFFAGDTGDASDRILLVTNPIFVELRNE